MKHGFRFAVHGLLTVVALTCVVAQTSHADETAAKTDRRKTGQVYLLTRPDGRSLLNRPESGANGKELQQELDRRARAIIRIVDRAKVDESLFVDNSGVRLYADSAESRELFARLPQESETGFTLSWIVRDLLGRRYAETGVEPEMIPVRNSISKTCGTEGMVRIKPGEFERKGQYFTARNTEVIKRTGDRYVVKVPAFFIDKYKVTNAEYCEFLNADNPGTGTGHGRIMPSHEMTTGHSLSPMARRSGRSSA